MIKDNTAYSLTAVLLFIIIIVIVTFHGNRNRLFASGTMKVTIENPEAAYDIWKEKQVKGRILLLFDNYPHMRGFYTYGGIPSLDRSNLVEFGVFQNIIRKIYLIIPDQEWEEFRQQETVHPLRKAAAGERGLYLYSMSGIPIIATTPASLPHIAEEPLVYVNDQKFDYEKTMDLLSRKKIASDIIIRCRVRGET
jgi:hypothetical protein